MVLSLTAATAGEVFTYIGYILLALVALMIMIVIHESGHYLAGKLLGFKIDEFGIGFGPPIVKKVNRKNGELFTLRPFPLGGFCSFHGEDEEGVEDEGSFNRQKPWKRLIVLFWRRAARARTALCASLQARLRAAPQRCALAGAVYRR